MNNKLSDEYIQAHFSSELWVDAANVPGADADTYQLLNHAWAVDKNRVYFEGEPLRGADRQSFKVLNELYARDAKKLYCKAESVAAVVDPANFQVLDTGEAVASHWVRYLGYARDGSNVYYAEAYSGAPSVVRGAEVHSFVSKGHGFGCDSNYAYYAGKRMKGSTALQFELLDAHHSRDAKSVFYLDRRIDGTVPADFEIIGEYIGRDKERVYDHGVPIAGVDPATYQELDGIYLFRDRSHVYASNEPQRHIDMDTFEFIGYDYFADKNGVYWRGKKIKGADRSSFEATGYNQANDKHRNYYNDGVDQSSKRSSISSGRLFGPWMAIKLILRTVTLVGGIMFSAWRHRRKVEHAVSHLPDSRPADMKTLAETLSQGNQDALIPVMLAINDMPAFIKEYGSRESYADEPDYAEALARSDDPAEAHPFLILEEVYQKHSLLGVIDWRSEPSETVSQVEPMLIRLGIRDFDWSFIDVLFEKGTGQEMCNNNFLSILRDRLAPHGLTLAHINLLGDSYGFAVLPLTDYEKIAGFSEEDLFEISTDFGADDGYDAALEILAEQEPNER
jgi:hypothetical protein